MREKMPENFIDKELSKDNEDALTVDEKIASCQRKIEELEGLIETLEEAQGALIESIEKEEVTNVRETYIQKFNEIEEELNMHRKKKEDISHDMESVKESLDSLADVDDNRLN